ncbi:transposase [Glutamicibacter sp. NPDC087344]|uniref:transposase n=1 Tax=Glutamicibacter sp. NPDC087344 TaxID=3363994 RepID=UPI00380850F7
MHPGARQTHKQLRNQDTLFAPALAGSFRYTFFLTNQRHPDMAVLDQRHRARTRCEEGSRNAKDIGPRNLPYQQWVKNERWTRIAFLAGQVTVYKQLLGLQRPQAARWEPKKLRARLFAIATKAVKNAHQMRICFYATTHEASLLAQALTRLRALRKHVNVHGSHVGMLL